MRGDDWITFRLYPTLDLAGSGIYFWGIGAQSYVGKATCLRSRLREYLNNVQKIELCLPYRKSKPGEFRPIHWALAVAKLARHPVEWRVLESCARGATLLERERHWISELKPTLNGRWSDI